MKVPTLLGYIEIQQVITNVMEKLSHFQGVRRLKNNQNVLVTRIYSLPMNMKKAAYEL